MILACCLQKAFNGVWKLSHAPLVESVKTLEEMKQTICKELSTSLCDSVCVCVFHLFQSLTKAVAAWLLQQMLAFLLLGSHQTLAKFIGKGCVLPGLLQGRNDAMGWKMP